MTNFVQVDPNTLTSGEEVRLEPMNSVTGSSEFTNFVGRVSLVDSATGYVSVRAQGSSTPVAFLISEWRFLAEERPEVIPQTDGLYVRKEQVASGIHPTQLMIFRRMDEVWDVLGGGTLPDPLPEDLIPLTAGARKTPTEAIPVVEEPAAEEPAPEPVVEEPPVDPTPENPVEDPNAQP